MKNFQFSIFNSQFKTSKGFAMLFSVLASTLVLSIGISIFNLTIKELTLSSIGRESQFAFYAADSGMDCVFYWEVTKSDKPLFATSSQSNGGWRDADIDAEAPTCAGTSLSSAMKNPISTSGSVPGSASTQFTITFPAPESYCAIVTVDKTVDGTGYISTRVTSRGYNTCDSTDPTRVERALVTNY